MQVYWLYTRYEFSLSEYENAMSDTVCDLIEDFRTTRYSDTDTADNKLSYTSRFSMNNSNDGKPGIKRVISVSSGKYYAHKLLGISEHRPLTAEEQLRAAELLNKDPMFKVSDTEYEADNAPSEMAVWRAFKAMAVEMKSPLTVAEVDSVLALSGFHAYVSLVTTDSTVWMPEVRTHTSLFAPHVVVSFPYSELERKSVEISCRIPTSEVFRRMLGSLSVAFVLSLFLIICLIWQFSTVLKLNRMDKMRSAFVTTMIHELKRPLSTLKMCVSGLENRTMMSSPEVRCELLADTRSSLDILSAYFAKLRDITFNESGQIPLNITSVDLAALFDRVAHSATVPGGKSVTFDNRIPRGLCVMADGAHLSNILGNLVENAVKYSGDNVTVTAEASVCDGMATICVADTGNGISEADLPRIFTRFYRGRAAMSDIPGMGLGLAYVRLLVEAHAGNVVASSTPGKGTCFTINLPQ